MGPRKLRPTGDPQEGPEIPGEDPTVEALVVITWALAAQMTNGQRNAACDQIQSAGDERDGVRAAVGLLTGYAA